MIRFFLAVNLCQLNMKMNKPSIIVAVVCLLGAIAIVCGKFKPSQGEQTSTATPAKELVATPHPQSAADGKKVLHFDGLRISPTLEE
jgi:hypothetical protein